MTRKALYTSPSNQITIGDYRLATWLPYECHPSSTPGKTQSICVDGELYGIVSDDTTPNVCVAVKMDWTGRHLEILSVFPDRLAKILMFPVSVAGVTCVYIFRGSRLLLTKDKFRTYQVLSEKLPFFDVCSAILTGRELRMLICRRRGWFFMSEHSVNSSDFGSAWRDLASHGKKYPIRHLQRMPCARGYAAGIGGRKQDKITYLIPGVHGPKRKENMIRTRDTIHDIGVDPIFGWLLLLRDSGLYEAPRVGSWGRICDNPYAQYGLLPLAKNAGYMKMHFMKDGDIVIALETYRNTETFPVFICQRQVRIDRHKLLVSELLNKAIRDSAIREHRPVQTLDVALLAEKLFPFLFPAICTTQVIRDTQLFA